MQRGLKHILTQKKNSGDCSSTNRRLSRNERGEYREMCVGEEEKYGTYLFSHDIGGLHDAARRQTVVSGQEDGLLQRHTQGAAVDHKRNTRSSTCNHTFPDCPV